MTDDLLCGADTARTAGQGHHPGLGELADSVGLEHRQERLQLGRGAGGLDGQGLGRDIVVVRLGDDIWRVCYPNIARDE